MLPQKINIAICDDKPEQTEYLKMLVSAWANENNTDITVGMFNSAENFKSAWSKNAKFNVLLLDIQMSGQNGVELAKEIRKSDEKMSIIFITGYADYISEGYDVSALHYLIKPIDADRFYLILNKAKKSIKKSNTAIFLPEINTRVLTDDIMCIESFDHILEIKTTDEKLAVKIPMYELEAQLGEDFIKCHRGCIVNLKYIKKITRTEVILDSGEILPLSRRLYKEVNRAVIKYFTEIKK